MKWKWGLIVLFILSIVLVGFWLTGGSSLVNLYRNYLSQDIANKKYTWDDFAERSENNLSAGYYAGSIGDNVFIWTLSGLKRYQHRDGVSVYRYIDTCQKIRDFAVQQGTTSGVSEISETIFINPVFTLAEWLYSVRRGDYVSVRYIDEAGIKIIDKIHSSSNQDYPIEQLRLEQCQD